MLRGDSCCLSCSVALGVRLTKLLLEGNDTKHVADVTAQPFPDGSMVIRAKGGNLFENYVVSEVYKSLKSVGENAEQWLYRDRDLTQRASSSLCAGPSFFRKD